MDPPALKRTAHFSSSQSMNKRPKIDSNGAAGSKGKMSFAERMMAKMGHQKGQGLGKDGAGIVNPIEVKLRPQGAGVGAVREKTQQAKDEARRAAERRGEEYEDSSEEERQQRKRRREAARGGATGQSKGPARPRQTFRTAAEIEAEGLEVPNVLKSLIDHTGGEAKLLLSTAGLMTNTNQVERSKVVTRARRDLDAFAESWHALNEREAMVDVQEAQSTEDVSTLEAECENVKKIAAAIRAVDLKGVSAFASSASPDDLRASLEILTSNLEQLQSKYPDDIDRFGLSEVAVSAIQHVFRQSMAIWSPLTDPLGIVPFLYRLKMILHISDDDALDLDGHEELLLPSRPASLYESLLRKFWLPRLRSVVLQEWDVSDATPLLLVMTTWKGVLPARVFDTVVNQLVAQRLLAALESWKPRADRGPKHQKKQPHQWIFPWLEYLDEYHLDPQSSNGILACVKRKLRSAFSTVDPSSDGIEGLDDWYQVTAIRGELDHAMKNNLLPRLARYMREHFAIDPSDQVLTPFERVLKWRRFFSAKSFSRLFLDAFFPEWHNILHLWLTEDPNYEEVAEWISWWQSQFPEEINAVPEISVEWDKGLNMLDDALSLGIDRSKTDLAPPQAGPSRPVTEKPLQSANAPSAPPASEEPSSLRELLEDLCARIGLLLLPLRQAHPESGHPLLRITPNMKGTGGIVGFLSGDGLFVQDKLDRSSWKRVAA